MLPRRGILRGGNRAHGARIFAQNRDARVGNLELPRHLIRERREGLTGDNESGNSAGFECFRVVETPRRAATSIGGAGEDEIRLTDQGLQ